MTTPCLFLILSCVFQRVLELEVAAVEHQFIFIDEVVFFFTVTVYTVNSSVVLYVVYVQLCVGWEWDVHCVHCFCRKNKIL